MAQRRTNKGQMLDFDALMIQNEKEIALGNMKVNARGDKLGPGGKVIQTREEVTREYYKNNPKAVVKSVSIKDAVDSKPVVDQSQAIVEKKSASKTKFLKSFFLLKFASPPSMSTIPFPRAFSFTCGLMIFHWALGSHLDSSNFPPSKSSSNRIAA